jgi:hypothetical protein
MPEQSSCLVERQLRGRHSGGDGETPEFAPTAMTQGGDA